MDQLENIIEGTIGKDAFLSFVLLSESHWDKKQFIDDFKTDWGIELPDKSDDDAVVVKVGDVTLIVSLLPAPVPDGEAEQNAGYNYMWKDAEEVAKSHKAHILVSVMRRGTDVLESGKLFTKAIASLLKQEYATAVFTDATVLQPEFYREVALMMKDDEEALPILDWIWFGIYRNDEYSGIYTYGMKKFGKEEIEVYADAELTDIRDFVLDVVCYIIDCDITLQDGETIGFTEEQKLLVTYSDGIAVEGKTLKIEYPQGEV